MKSQSDIIPTKVQTLCMIVRHPEILLGMKKRGFGAGRWNGFGGHVEEGESIEDAAKREVMEEAGLEIHEFDKRGVIRCTFEGGDGVREIHIFAATRFSGEPSESDEMKPQWFNLMKIPFSEMWRADAYWMPLFLKGSRFEGRFHFDDKHNVVNHLVIEVD